MHITSRRLILSILFIICLSFQASAWNPMIVTSGVSSEAESECPSGYTSCIISGDFDHSSGVTYFCEADEDAVAFDSNNLLTGTDYGEGSPDIGARIEDANEMMKINDASAYIKGDQAQTIWFRIYISGTPDAFTPFWESYDTGASNKIRCMVATSGQIYCEYDTASAVADDAYGVSPSLGEWVDIAYSWDQPNGDHSVNTSGSWQDDNDELLDAMTGTLDTFVIGEEFSGFGDPTATYINITKWALLSGYKTAKPW